MTPKTAYQKMRDNRVRRESRRVNGQPAAAMQGSSSVTLEDCSTLIASGQNSFDFDPGLSIAMYEASKRGELRNGLAWYKEDGVWVHSDMRFPDEA